MPDRCLDALAGAGLMLHEDREEPHSEGRADKSRDEVIGDAVERHAQRAAALVIELHAQGLQRHRGRRRAAGRDEADLGVVPCRETLRRGRPINREGSIERATRLRRFRRQRPGLAAIEIER